MLGTRPIASKIMILLVLFIYFKFSMFGGEKRNLHLLRSKTYSNASQFINCYKTSTKILFTKTFCKIISAVWSFFPS